MARQKQRAERQAVTIVFEFVPDVSVRFPGTHDLSGHVATGPTGIQALANARSLVARAFPSHKFEVTEKLRIPLTQTDLSFPAGTSVTKVIGALIASAGLNRSAGQEVKSE